MNPPTTDITSSTTDSTSNATATLLLEDEEEKTPVYKVKPGTGEPIWDTDKKEKLLEWRARHQKWENNRGSKLDPDEGKSTPTPNSPHVPIASGSTIVQGQLRVLSRQATLSVRNRHSVNQPRHIDFRVHENYDGGIFGELAGVRGLMMGHRGTILPGFYARFTGISSGDLSDKTGYFQLEDNVSLIKGKLNTVFGSVKKIQRETDVSNYGDPEIADKILEVPLQLMAVAIEAIVEKEASYKDQQEAFDAAFDALEKAQPLLRRHQCDLTLVTIGEPNDSIVLEESKLYLTKVKAENLQRAGKKVRGRRLCQCTLLSGSIRVVYHTDNEGTKWKVPFLKHLRSFSHIEALNPELDERSDEEKRFRRKPFSLPKTPTDEEFWRDLVDRGVAEPPYTVRFNDKNALIRKPRFAGLGKEEPLIPAPEKKASDITVADMRAWANSRLSDNDVLVKIKEQMDLIRKEKSLEKNRYKSGDFAVEPKVEKKKKISPAIQPNNPGEVAVTNGTSSATVIEKEAVEDPELVSVESGSPDGKSPVQRFLDWKMWGAKNSPNP